MPQLKYLLYLLKTMESNIFMPHVYVKRYPNYYSWAVLLLLLLLLLLLS